MSFLKISFRKRALTEGDDVQEVFERVRGEYSFLLQSGGNTGESARYSYLGYDPFLVVWAKGGVDQMIRRRDFCGFKKSGVGQIVEKKGAWVVTDLLERFQYKGSLPVPFCGGAVGYMGYDFGCRFTGVRQKVFDDMGIPDFIFGFYDKVVAFDHKENLLYLIGVADTDMGAERKVREIAEDLERAPAFRRRGEAGKPRSNVSEEVYLKKVAWVKELLRQGETYQVNFSQRFTADCTMDGFGVYRRLYQANPAPFACYFDYPDLDIVSCSPELLFRKRGRKVETWPIKGTVARGKSDEEDSARVRELLASEKDDAELSMIVDLARNDLGRVCKVGSVKVEGHREVLKASHVIHTYSRVSGELSEKKGIYDCVEALFPGGSITGCPKKRTMEIIDQLEDFKRGVYTGSAGFMGFGGEVDLNILIRTMLIKDDVAYFSAGGGIVIDSDAAAEYKESVAKAQALIDVLNV